MNRDPETRLMRDGEQSGRRGPRKEYEVRIVLPLTTEMLAGIDGAKAPDETRLDMIRAAIAREIERRRRVSNRTR